MKQKIKEVIRESPVLGSLIGNAYRRLRAAEGRRRLRKCVELPSIKLVVGASGVFSDSWIQTDVEYLNLLKPEHWRAYFRKNSIDAILAEHVWEHLSQDEGLQAAERCFEYLKPGGYLRVAVPDGCHPDQEYVSQVKVGGTGSGADDHKVLYTFESLRSLFTTAGFTVALLEYFDEEGNFHFENWDPDAGLICRSKRFDSRNQSGMLRYTSIILDAHKD